jgi:hypothetical protein
MATTYHASQTVQCWKVHTCVDCGCGFRYRFERALKATGNTEAKAQANLEKQVDAAVQNQVDVHPCPWCGRIQPDMVGQTKRTQHFWIGIGTVILAIVVLVLGGARVLWFNQTAIVMACLLAASAVLDWFVARRDPNRDLSGNFENAEALLQDRKIEIVKKGAEPEAVEAESLMNAWHWLALVLAAVAVQVALTPMIFQQVNQLPFNVGVTPDIVSPGDSFTIWFPQTIDCIDNKWRGTPHSIVINPEEVGNVQLRVTAASSDWGITINVKDGNTHTSARPSATATIPAITPVAGKTVRIRTEMDVEFPFATSSTSFDVRRAQLAADTAVTFAPRGMGGAYQAIWFLALMTAPLLSLAAALGLWKLDRQLQATAIPPIAEPLAKPVGPARPVMGGMRDDAPRPPDLPRNAIRKPREK